MFEKDGIEIIKSFLPEETLRNLNSELDLIFSKCSINGSLSSTQVFGGWERNILECTIPGLLCSVNIFEIIVDVAEQFKKNSCFASEDYVLAGLRIFSEKENSDPLFWHTDNRKGMLRAIVYLMGGEDDSGKFMYIKGSHNRDYQIAHKLPLEKVRQLQNFVLECTAPRGSLIIFDSNGFHAKKKCVEERRILFLEFHPRNNQFAKERILLPSNHLTEKIIFNIGLFANTDFTTEDIGVQGHEAELQNPAPLPFKVSMQELIKSARYSLIRSLRKIWKSVPVFKKFKPFSLR
jgi:hypothetical protein